MLQKKNFMKYFKKLKKIKEKECLFKHNNIYPGLKNTDKNNWRINFIKYKLANKLYEQIMAMDLKEIEKLIKEALPDAFVDIQDLAGDGNHYSATVTSSQFSGKSKIEQHKMVYNSLKGKMGNELHALAIKTKE